MNNSNLNSLQAAPPLNFFQDYALLETPQGDVQAKVQSILGKIELYNQTDPTIATIQRKLQRLNEKLNAPLTSQAFITLFFLHHIKLNRLFSKLDQDARLHFYHLCQIPAINTPEALFFLFKWEKNHFRDRLQAIFFPKHPGKPFPKTNVMLEVGLLIKRKGLFLRRDLNDLFDLCDLKEKKELYQIILSFKNSSSPEIKTILCNLTVKLFLAFIKNPDSNLASNKSLGTLLDYLKSFFTDAFEFKVKLSLFEGIKAISSAQPEFKQIMEALTADLIATTQISTPDHFFSLLANFDPTLLLKILHKESFQFIELKAQYLIGLGLMLQQDSIKILRHLSFDCLLKVAPCRNSAQLAQVIFLFKKKLSTCFTQLAKDDINVVQIIQSFALPSLKNFVEDLNLRLFLKSDHLSTTCFKTALKNNCLEIHHLEQISHQFQIYFKLPPPFFRDPAVQGEAINSESRTSLIYFLGALIHLLNQIEFNTAEELDVALRHLLAFFPKEVLHVFLNTSNQSLSISFARHLVGLHCMMTSDELKAPTADLKHFFDVHLNKLLTLKAMNEEDVSTYLIQFQEDFLMATYEEARLFGGNQSDFFPPCLRHFNEFLTNYSAQRALFNSKEFIQNRLLEWLKKFSPEKIAMIIRGFSSTATTDQQLELFWNRVAHFLDHESSLECSLFLKTYLKTFNRSCLLPILKKIAPRLHEEEYYTLLPLFDSLKRYDNETLFNIFHKVLKEIPPNNTKALKNYIFFFYHRYENIFARIFFCSNIQYCPDALGKMSLKIIFEKDLFKTLPEAALAKLQNHFMILIGELSLNPEQSIRDLYHLTPHPKEHPWCDSLPDKPLTDPQSLNWINKHQIKILSLMPPGLLKQTLISLISYYGDLVSASSLAGYPTELLENILKYYQTWLHDLHQGEFFL